MHSYETDPYFKHHVLADTTILMSHFLMLVRSDCTLRIFFFVLSEI